MKLLQSALLFWILGAGWAVAQAVEQGIIVTGEGRVSSAPDMASITLQKTAAVF